ncbi:rhodanese-like domain-containing protein [Ilumatobacter sp.]|uniref:rhodanese-like domain-containing protein n=1 Tax=Ilumatobacter sp. TaxID=1967498 RepID=UPI003C504FB8
MAIDEISVSDLHALGPDVVVVDVREDDEWAAGHVPHARHVVLATVPGHLDAFDGDPTYVMCKVGGRSYRACEFVAGEGRSVVNVAGGMLAWIEAGFDVTTGTATTDV